MRKGIPVACCHTVFTKEQRIEYKSTWGELELRRIGIMEIEQGYQYQFPGDSETLRLVNGEKMLSVFNLYGDCK
jgi:hypothetical protein